MHQGAPRGRVEETVAAFEKLGWSGMMVGFFDHDDQESIESAEPVLEAAAKARMAGLMEAGSATAKTTGCIRSGASDDRIAAAPSLTQWGCSSRFHPYR